MTREQVAKLIEAAAEGSVRIDMNQTEYGIQRDMEAIAPLIVRGFLSYSWTELLAFNITPAGERYLEDHDAETALMFPCKYADDWTLTPPDRFDGLAVRS